MEEKAIGKFDCEQKGCQVKTTGVCLEAFTDVEKCPHHKLLTISGDPDPDGADKKNKTEDLERPLFTGDEVVESNLHLLTNRYYTKLVLLMGDSEAGKTTLIASLFDRFQKGPCAGYNYGGSRTQMGFEKRCFLARWNVERKVPDTERTKSLEMQYLHLALRDEHRKGAMEHLLFTDVSGEQFRIIRDYEDQMKRFSILSRADCIFFVVNGEQLIDPEARHKAKSNTVKLIMRANECGMIKEGTPFHFVITKFDKIHAHMESVNSFFTADIKARFGEQVKGFLNVASRSVDETISAGAGLDGFLERILTSSHTRLAMPVPKVLPTREFHRF